MDEEVMAGSLEDESDEELTKSELVSAEEIRELAVGDFVLSCDGLQVSAMVELPDTSVLVTGESSSLDTSVVGD